jgi:hypothetical protein
VPLVESIQLCAAVSQVVTYLRRHLHGPGDTNIISVDEDLDREGRIRYAIILQCKSSTLHYTPDVLTARSPNFTAETICYESI